MTGTKSAYHPTPRARIVHPMTDTTTDRMDAALEAAGLPLRREPTELRVIDDAIAALERATATLRAARVALAEDAPGR